MSKKKVTAQDRRIIQLYKKGKTVQAIATSINKPCSHVYGVLRENDIKRRPRGRKPKTIISVDKMLELYIGGMTLEAIGKKAKLSRESIRLKLKDHPDYIAAVAAR